MRIANKITVVQVLSNLRKSEVKSQETFPATSFSPDEATDEAIKNNIVSQIANTPHQVEDHKNYHAAAEHMSRPIKKKSKLAVEDVTDFDPEKGEGKLNYLQHIDREAASPNKFQINPIHLFRSYKSSPHSPLSLALKYLVHRVEHQSEYSNPETASVMDNEFLAHHEVPGKAEAVTSQDLNTFLYHHADLIPGVLKMQREIHNSIHKYSPWAVSQDKNGQPAVHLTRGLKVGAEGRGPDHSLASYADVPEPPFGHVKHHQTVPMKNLWYSYDIGPEDASSSEYGSENEYLVSPHENQTYSVTGNYPKDSKTEKILPYDGHILDKKRGWEIQDPFNYRQHVSANADKVDAKTLDKLANGGVPGFIDSEKLLKNPNLTLDNAIKLNFQLKKEGYFGFPKGLLDWSLQHQDTPNTIGLLNRATEDATNPAFKGMPGSKFQLVDLAEMLHGINNEATIQHDPHGYVSGWVKKNAPAIRQRLDVLKGIASRERMPDRRMSDQISEINQVLDDISSRQYPVESQTPLKKTMVTPLDVAKIIGKMAPKRWPHYNTTSTKKLQNGLYHHILEHEHDPRALIHAISKDSDPNKPYLSAIWGGASPKDGFFVSSSKVDPKQKGKGYGKLAYLAAIAHHGTISSDSHTSKFADKLWEDLPTLHPGIVRKVGTPGTQESHTATVDKPTQESLKTKLYGADYSRLSDRLFKSEVENRKLLVKLDRNYEVSGLAGYSQDGKTVYIDKRIGEFKGHDVAKFLLVHEVTEKALEDKLGYGYETAHSLALRAEQRAAEEAGLSWPDYCHFMRSLMEKIGRKGQAKNVPSDLENPSAEHSELKVQGYRHNLAKSDPGSKFVASVIVRAGKYLLMGQRKDGQWNLPGGKSLPNESPEGCANRELFEETGIVPEKLEHLATKEVTGRMGGKVSVSSFLAQGHFGFNAPQNPDRDGETWHWIDVSKGLPANIKNNLRNPQDVGLIKLGLVEDTLEKAAYGKYPGDVHPQKPHLEWTRLKSGQMAWHPNKATTLQYEKENKINSANYLSRVPPEHKELIGSFVNKVLTHPDRHARTARDKNGNWIVRARNLHGLFSGDPNSKLTVTTPDTLEFSLNERHGNNAEENALGTKWRYTKSKNSVEFIP